MGGKVKHCEWCGGFTTNSKVLLSKTPILEPMEEIIDDNGRNEILNDYYTGEYLNIKDIQTELNITSYLDLLSNLEMIVICDSCLELNDKNELKYYNLDLGYD